MRGRGLLRWAPPLLAAPALWAQLDPSSAALLERIRQKAADNLAHLPDYTCRLTIERTMRPPASRQFQPYDTLRLEVAYVGGRELYSWPGASRFEDQRIDELVGGGAISSGSFALHAWTIFRTTVPTFTHLEEEPLEGRRAIRCDYRVPRRESRFLIRAGPTKQGVAGYHGSFWADAQTLELMRLEVHCDDIPPELEVAAASNIIVYHPTPIGDKEFLLARSAELEMRESSGLVTRNATHFDACRQYLGESAVSFGEPAPAAEAARAVSVVRLPPGLGVAVVLETPIDGARSAVGDPVTATVDRNARKEDTVFLPKGALLKGRITRLQRRRAPRWNFYVYVVGIEFHSAEFNHTRADFTGVLEDVYAALPALLGASPAQPGRSGDLALKPLPGEGIFFVKGDRLRLPAGLRMQWRTVEPQP